MKKILITILCILLMVALFAGCSCERGAIDPTEATEDVSEPTEGEILLPIEGSLDMIYSSGAGAWESHISLKADGSFTGGYHDMDMGFSGDGYDATVYESIFKGKFKDIKMTEDYAFEMTLDWVETAKKEGTEVIEDQGGVLVRKVSSEAMGIAGGDKFILYLPTAPVSELSEEFLWWNPGRYEETETLQRYGLYNVVTDAGFFCYD